MPLLRQVIGWSLGSLAKTMLEHAPASAVILVAADRALPGREVSLCHVHDALACFTVRLAERTAPNGLLNLIADCGLACRAAQWRQKRLEECCAAALGCLASNTASWSLVMDPSKAVPLLKPQQQTAAPARKSTGRPDNAASSGLEVGPAAGVMNGREAQDAGVRLGGYSAWSMGGFLLALTAAMADAVQQTEVRCRAVHEHGQFLEHGPENRWVASSAC